VKIRRSRLTGDFVQVPNATARDDNLSHMARGVLVELLSRPDGWETTADDMWRESVKRHGKDSPGRRQFRAAFAELKAHGYMVAERELLAGGRHGTVLTVRDLPVQADVPHGGTSEAGPASPDQENAGHSDVPPAGTSESGSGSAEGNAAGHTDVPQAGTPELADVPDGGTSGRPAKTDVSAGGTDVPLSDVPHAGTSSVKRSLNTEEKTGGSGRRPTTGRGASRAGGSAAQGDESSRKVATEAIQCVIAAYPVWLRKQLEKACKTMPDNVVAAIRTELANGITVDQLAARIDRRWPKRRFEDDALSATGKGITNLFAVAFELVQHGDCPHPLCDDGTDLATGQDCRTCERTREDRQPAPQEHVQGAFPVGLPGGAPEPAPTPLGRRQRRTVRDCTNKLCPNSYSAPADAPPGPCRECRASDREASNA
jgi:hypothetical protein